MLTMFKDLRGRRVRAQDGGGGRLDDIYFDDRTGKIRYLVLSLGRWPRMRRVLVAPTQVSDHTDGTLSIAMAREDVLTSPHPDTDPPVSRQQFLQAQQMTPEMNLLGAGLAAGMIPPITAESIEAEVSQVVRQETSQFQADELPFNAAHTDSDSPLNHHLTPFDILLRNRKREQHQAHLRSVREVVTYEIELECGRAGRMADVWIDTQTWKLTHLSLRLQALKGRVAVPATLVRGISWGTGTVRLSADWGQSNDGLCLMPSHSTPQPQNYRWGHISPSHAS